ncbi:hypothetical protein CHUAL_013056 [Chamberlinius hualienensis]
MSLLNCFIIFSTWVMFTGTEGRKCFRPGKGVHVVESISANHSDGLYPTGTSINYSCDPGYTILQSKQKTCLKNGTWTGNDAYCGINVAETASVELIRTNNYVERHNLLTKIFSNDLSICIKVDQVNSSHAWYIKLNKNYTLDLVQVTIKQNSGGLEIPEIRFSPENFNENTYQITKSESTSLIGTYKTRINNETLYVYTYKIEKPKSSQFATLIIIWPKISFFLCHLELFTSLDVSNSLCDIDGQKFSKQLSYFYFNKCYAVFPPNTTSNWHNANEICNNFKRNSSSLLYLDTNGISALNYMFSYISKTISPNSLKGRNYWAKSSAATPSYVTMKSTVSYSDQSPGFTYSPICEYDLPRCGSPEQRSGTLMTHYGHQVHYSCPKYFTLDGPSMRNCSNGRWSSDLPQCIHRDNTNKPRKGNDSPCSSHCDNQERKLLRETVETIIFVVAGILIVQWVVTGVAYVYLNFFY